VGRSASSTAILGVIPSALGEFIKAGNEYSKVKLLAKSSEEFQILLEGEDELLQFDSTHSSLVDLIHKNGGIENPDANILNLKDRQVYGKKHLFSIDCEISAILESKGI